MIRLADTPIARAITGIAALALAGGVLAYYFFGVEKGRESVKAPWRNFYSQLRPGWVKLTEDEMRDTLQKGDPEPMTLMAIRTALVRWRLKEVAPEAFPNLMRDYDRGFWLADSDAWTRTFQALDRGWVEARQRALRTATPLQRPSVSKQGPDGLTIVLPQGTYAPQLGTRIRLAADCTTESLPTAAPKLYWETTQATGISPYRRRVAAWEVSTTGTVAGMQRVSLTVDMASEPQWVVPWSQPTALHLRSPGASSWKNLSIEFDDSPTLPIE